MRRGHAIAAMREAQKIADRKLKQLTKDAESAIKKLIQKPGRSVMLVVVDKGGKHIFGQEFVRVGMTANSDGSIDEIDELFAAEMKPIEQKLSSL